MQSLEGTLAQRFRKSGAGYAFLTPWVIGLVGLTLGPTLVSLYLSFTQFNLFQPPRWIGAANYVRIATNDPFGTEFHSIVAWGKLAEIAGTVLAKGRLVHIEGRLHGSTWQTSDGSKRRTVEIVAGRLQALDAKATPEIEAA